MDLSPVQQAVAQLVALFEPGEYVNLRAGELVGEALQVGAHGWRHVL